MIDIPDAALAAKLKEKVQAFNASSGKYIWLTGIPLILLHLARYVLPPSLAGAYDAVVTTGLVGAYGVWSEGEKKKVLQ